MWKLSVHLNTELAAIRAVRHLVACACRSEGATEVESGLVEMSVGEAVANARLHAYGNGLGPLMIDLEYERPVMTVSVHDEGAPVVGADAIPDSPPEHESRGWGLYVIGQAMDEVEILRKPHTAQGTLIRMTKNFSVIQAPITHE